MTVYSSFAIAFLLAFVVLTFLSMIFHTFDVKMKFFRDWRYIVLGAGAVGLGSATSFYLWF